MSETNSMDTKEKVFGIGLHKTGTTTLGRCLEILGYHPHISHHLESLQTWKTQGFEAVLPIIEAHRSFEDWPWPLMYPLLLKQFPNSKFILTKRESSAKWYSSLRRHAQKTGPTEFRQLIYGYATPEENPAHHISFYERHNREVIQFFQTHAPQQLLVVCWEDGDDWTPLCSFLNRPEPSLPFPHLNQRQLTWQKSLRRWLYLRLKKR
ncbi:MAG: sulfotransferase family protein [Bacteroidota bacterium]